MKKMFLIPIMIIFLILSSCGAPSSVPINEDNPTATSKIDPPVFDILSERYIYELGKEIAVKSIIPINSDTSSDYSVNQIMRAAKNEVARQGYTNSNDPLKIVPAVISGIKLETIASGATVEKNVDFASKTDNLYLGVLENPDVKAPVAGVDTWNKKDVIKNMTKGLVGPLVAVKPSAHYRALDSGLEVDDAKINIKANVKSLISSIPGEDVDSTKNIVNESIMSGIKALVLSNITDPELYSSIVTGIVEGLDLLADSKPVIKSELKNIIKDLVKYSGRVIKSLEIDNHLTDQTLINNIKIAIANEIASVTSEWGENKIVAEDSNTDFNSGILEPITVSDYIVSYPDDEFLVLKFKTISKIEREQFWRGAVNTGTLVGEVLYAYDALGNIASKTWKYGGQVWAVDDKFEYNGLKMIKDNNGMEVTYDDLGRVQKFGWFDFDYNSDGSAFRNYYGSDGVKKGYSDYTISYKMGASPVGSGYFWYGNNCNSGWLSWEDTDRYDVVIGISTLSYKDKIESVLSKWYNEPRI